MRPCKCNKVGWRMLLVLSMCPAALAAEEPAAQAGSKITVTANVLSAFHLGDSQDKVPFVYVLDGPPEIRKEVEQLVAEHFPEHGLDAKAARKLQDLWGERLKYFISGPHTEKLYAESKYGSPIMSLTGTVEIKEGKKWLAVEKFEQTRFTYPARMLAPDKPFTISKKEPLVLKVTDALSIKCIHVAPGEIFAGEPYYQAPHWMEDPPHQVTLTKGYYLAEHPVTQEMFEALMGANPNERKLANAPVNSSCADAYGFCKRLAEKTGRKIRLPTAAEWDFAARVGTSNPPFREKYKEQESGVGKGIPKDPVPVKSAKPNAWGFYDMFSWGGWERVSDGNSKRDRQDVTDPQHIPAEDQNDPATVRKHPHICKGYAGLALGEIEFINSDRGPEKKYPGVLRFRIVVDEEN